MCFQKNVQIPGERGLVEFENTNALSHRNLFFIKCFSDMDATRNARTNGTKISNQFARIGARWHSRQRVDLFTSNN